MRSLCLAAVLTLSATAAFADDPPPAFDGDLVSPGKTWWCLSSGDRFCTRERTACDRSCKQTAKVFAYTLAIDELGRAGEPALAFATGAACETSRAKERLASACKAIGATTLRPVAAGDSPGTGWFCYTNHGEAESGACARSLDLCVALRAQTATSALNDASDPSSCEPASSAWAIRVGHAVIARATKPACEELRKLRRLQAPRQLAITTGCTLLR